MGDDYYEYVAEKEERRQRRADSQWTYLWLGWAPPLWPWYAFCAVVGVPMTGLLLYREDWPGVAFLVFWTSAGAVMAKIARRQRKEWKQRHAASPDAE